MRIIRFSIIALSLCCIFQSCLKVNQGPEVTGPDPLWPEVIVLWPGEDSVITVNSDFPKIVKVTSADEKVVQITIQDNGIKLSAGTLGITTIQITDEANQTITRDVRSMNLTYMWRNLVNDSTYKTSVVVQADDPVFAANLEEQLLLEAKAPYGIDFGLGLPENGTGSFRHTAPGNPSIITTGTFDFGELTLELDLPDSRIMYKVIPVKNREVLGLEQDLTEYYKVLHPDKNIQKIIVTQYIKRYFPLG